MTPNIEQEHHFYKIPDATAEGEFHTLQFMRKDPNGDTVAGVTNEAVIEVLIHRITELNKKFGCRENSLAITKLEEALMWLEARTKERKNRGVEGKHEA